MKENEKISRDLKIIIIGDSGTGKTTLIKRYLGEEITSIKPTIVSEYSTKIFEHNDKMYRIQLWDIGGQDKSTTIAKVFSRESHGCIIVSSVNNNQTLENTENWKETVKDDCKFIDGDDIPFFLLRNKIDLIQTEEEKESIEKETKIFCDEKGFDLYSITSALENINVKEGIDSFFKHVIERLERYLNKGNNIAGRESVKLNQNVGVRGKEQQNSKKCC
jgi:small GTP-binding protein